MARQETQQERLTREAFERGTVAKSRSDARDARRGPR
jgi:hypothetical protein